MGIHELPRSLGDAATEPLGPRILAVDDEPDLLALLEILLRRAPGELRTAGDGVEAIEVLAQWPADILIVDLQMPRMGGRELLAYVRHRHPEAVAAVLTAHGAEEVAAEMLRDLGAADYLPKTGLSEERLLRMLERLDLERRVAAVRRDAGFAVFEVERPGAAHVVLAGSLVGDVTFARVAHLRSALDGLEGTKAAGLVLDLRYLSDLVPAGLMEAVLVREELRKKGADLVLARPSGEVAEVVRLFSEDTAGIPTGLRVFATVKSALEAIEGAEG